MLQTVCMSDLKFPKYGFDNTLKEIPFDRDEYISYRDQLQKELAVCDSASRRSLLESLGMCVRIMGDLDLAEKYLTEAVVLSQTEPMWKLAQNKMRLAHVYHWKSNFVKAHQLFDETKTILSAERDIVPLQASYHQHLGKLYFDQKNYAYALSEFEKALAIRKDLRLSEDLISSSQFAIETTKKVLHKTR
jgi:tetratricopeptide (TPR) repeat protein